jgi:hypothetical protein
LSRDAYLLAAQNGHHTILEWVNANGL